MGVVHSHQPLYTCEPRADGKYTRGPTLIRDGAVPGRDLQQAGRCGGEYQQKTPRSPGIWSWRAVRGNVPRAGALIDANKTAVYEMKESR